MQVARNLTQDEWGVLKPGAYIIHDRDTKFCDAFKQIPDDAGVKRLPGPPRSPNLKEVAWFTPNPLSETTCFCGLYLSSSSSMAHGPVIRRSRPKPLHEQKRVSSTCLGDDPCKSWIGR